MLVKRSAAPDGHLDFQNQDANRPAPNSSDSVSVASLVHTHKEGNALGIRPACSDSCGRLAIID
jgi:hypothetical protein